MFRNPCMYIVREIIGVLTKNSLICLHTVKQLCTDEIEIIIMIIDM